MRFLLYIIVSIFSGVFAGMGMGGGTFLIPMLSLFFSIEQIYCQSTNVLCFIILAIFCFIIYVKNKFINFKILLCVAIPATVISFGSSLFAVKVESNLLHILFALFILIIGIISFFGCVKNLKKKK